MHHELKVTLLLQWALLLVSSLYCILMSLTGGDQTHLLSDCKASDPRIASLIVTWYLGYKVCPLCTSSVQNKQSYYLAVYMRHTGNLRDWCLPWPWPTAKVWLVWSLLSKGWRNTLGYCFYHSRSDVWPCSPTSSRNAEHKGTKEGNNLQICTEHLWLSWDRPALFAQSLKRRSPAPLCSIISARWRLLFGCFCLEKLSPRDMLTSSGTDPSGFGVIRITGVKHPQYSYHTSKEGHHRVSSMFDSTCFLVPSRHSNIA